MKPDSNLLKQSKAIEYEQATLEKGDSTAQPSYAASPAEAMQASALSHDSGIFAVAESYPDLKANTNYLKLKEELSNTENKILILVSFMVSNYNYNVKLETFSRAILFAGCLALKLQTSSKHQKKKGCTKVGFGSTGLGD